jgi:tetratricopeptide (TPR) repeat protein
VLRQAEEAVELAQGDPRKARALATAALAGADGDQEVIVVARRALGLAARQLQDLASAQTELRTAVRIAERAGLARRAGEARLSLALVLSYLGRQRAAMRAIERAATELRGQDRARLHMQRALLLQRMGRTDEALDGYRRALTGLRRHGDRLWEARLLVNRGLLRAYRGDLAGAADDHRAGRRLAEELGQELMVALIDHNLGFIAGRAGNIPEALAWFDKAEQTYVAQDAPMAVLHADRAELLLAANLVAEAVASARAAVDELARAGNVVELAEARLLLARAELATGAAGDARRAARTARAQFRRQGRDAWALLAAAVACEAAVAASRPHRPPARLVDEARELAAQLAEAGWEVEAGAARLVAGRLALARGETATARADLALAGTSGRQRPVIQRIQVRQALALLCLVDGDSRAALRHLGAGIRLLEQHRASLGATELRAVAGALGVELTALGLRNALARGRPADVLWWAERSRAVTLRVATVRPPPDPVLAGLLAELRRVAADERAAATQAGDVTPFLARRAAVEQAVRRHTRQVAGSRQAAALPSGGRVAHDALADHMLVEYAVVDGDLLAIVMARRRTTVHPLGPAGPVLAEADAARFALRRLARGASGRAEVAGRAALATGGRVLDELLLAPLHDRVAGDVPLVVVPTGSLHGIPWAAVPSLTGRAVSVAPSAAVWLDARRRPVVGPPDRVVAVAGPGLAAAAAEVAAVARHYPRAQVFTGTAATTANLMSALDGAAVGHVAAHGELRADSPLFSSLLLDDGPLTAYELEGLRRPPPLLVLSSCDAGVTEVRPGDELLGLSSALLAIGARAVVAPVVAVADEASSALMDDLHGHLCAGLGPAEAVARLAAGPARSSSEAFAASMSFVCFGAG